MRGVHVLCMLENEDVYTLVANAGKKSIENDVESLSTNLSAPMTMALFRLCGCECTFYGRMIA